jgi:hypothetical protein
VGRSSGIPYFNVLSQHLPKGGQGKPQEALIRMVLEYVSELHFEEPDLLSS